MSANPLEIFTNYGHVDNTGGRPPAFHERRHRPRVRVNWPLVLFRSTESEIVESVTVDLNSRGFYCSTPVPFGVGELLSCAMRVPTHEPHTRMPERSMECRVRVIRVMRENDGNFGVACEIEDYHFAPGVTTA